MSLLRVIAPCLLYGAIAAVGLEAQQPTTHIIKSAPTCARCSIVLEPEVTLQLPWDSLSFAFPNKFVRLANGGFLSTELTETDIPAYFDSTGKFVRLIARRGQGPGEIERYGDDPIAVGSGDSVWIFSDERRYVFTPDMRFVRMDRISNIEQSVLPTSDGGMVIAAVGVSGVGAGLPIHIMNRAGTIVRSFGFDTPSPVPYGRASRAVQRRWGRELTAGATGTFWVRAWGGQFFLEQYDYQGNLLARATHARDGWYAAEADKMYGRGSDSLPSIARVVGSNDPGVLWLIYGFQNASYVQPRDLNWSTLAPMYDVVIEAIDTRTFQVLATRRLSNTAAGYLDNAPDMLPIIKPLDDTFHTFVMNRLRLVRPRQ